MRYYTIQPPARLARYVRLFWVYEGEATQARPYIYRGFADGCTEFVFHYRGPFDNLLADGSSERSLVAGIHAQTRKYTRWVVDRDWAIFGCYLYPYALPRLFGFPADDFTDGLTDFRSVLGPAGAELEERMLAADDDPGRLAILSDFLIGQLERRKRELPPVFTSINRMIEARGLIGVSKLASEYAMSNRQFERKFREFSGFTPKFYSRIIRFQAALKKFGSDSSLTDIAYACGYFDQSHFINDFKEFSGYNPKIYFSGAAEGSEYLEA